MEAEGWGAIAGGAATLVAALKVPEILKNWKEARSLKNSRILKDLHETQARCKSLEDELNITKDSLRDLQLKLSIIIPIVLRKSEEDTDVQELMRFLEKDTGINVTAKNDQ